MKITENFGSESKFSIGELVWWSDLREKDRKQFGIIEKFIKKYEGGRILVFARLFCVSKSKYEEILVINLHKVESKN
jgi:hypothetical protein